MSCILRIEIIEAVKRKFAAPTSRLKNPSCVPTAIGLKLFTTGGLTVVAKEEKKMADIMS